MPSLKSALRVMLILVLLADGMTAAWASTGMALKAVDHLTTSKEEVASNKVADATDCDRTSQDGKGAKPADSTHSDCDCASQSACGCSCLLTFFPASRVFRFASQHLLYNQPAAKPLVQPVLTPISAVFRPPIS